MTARTLFDGIDRDELALVTEHIGLAIAGANATASCAVVRDPRVSPDGLVAGLCKAHALGLASAIVSAGRPLGMEGADLVVMEEALLAASIAIVRETIAEARAGRRGMGIWL